MPEIDALQALTTSIGEYTVDALGRERLSDMQVTLDPVDRVAHVAIVLVDNSDAEQMQVLKELFEVEEVFYDEAALTFAFRESLDNDRAALRSVPLYSLA